MQNSRSDLRMWISIKDVKHGNDNVILSTGFTDMTKAINDANAIITDKFGMDRQLEFTRPHKKRKR